MTEQALRPLDGDEPWVAVVNALAEVVAALADRVALLEATVLATAADRDNWKLAFRLATAGDLALYEPKADQ